MEIPIVSGHSLKSYQRLFPNFPPPGDLPENSNFAQADILQELQQAVQAAGTTRRGAKATSSASEGGMRQGEELERRALRVKNAVDSYRLETRALSSEEQTAHSQRLKAIEEGLRLARQQIEWKRYDASTAAGAGEAAADAALPEEAAEGATVAEDPRIHLFA